MHQNVTTEITAIYFVRIISRPSQLWGTMRDYILAMRFGSARKLHTAPTLSAAYFVTDAFANVRREIVREARRSYHLRVRHHLCENAALAYAHRVDRSNYRIFPTSSQPCAPTF